MLFSSSNLVTGLLPIVRRSDPIHVYVNWRAALREHDFHSPAVIRMKPE